METDQFRNQSTVEIRLLVRHLSFILCRKRAITQCLDTHRAFENLYQQEDRVLDNLQRRVEKVEPIPTESKKLQQMAKNVTVNLHSSLHFSHLSDNSQDLFNDILARAQSIEHMNDVAVKFIEETKVTSSHAYLLYSPTVMLLKKFVPLSQGSVCLICVYCFACLSMIQSNA